MGSLAVTALTLSHFRSHRAARLALGWPADRHLRAKRRGQDEHP